jgi:hypothetical protein
LSWPAGRAVQTLDMIKEYNILWFEIAFLWMARVWSLFEHQCLSAVRSCVKTRCEIQWCGWCSLTVGFLQGCAYQQWAHVLRLAVRSNDVVMLSVSGFPPGLCLSAVRSCVKTHCGIQWCGWCSLDSGLPPGLCLSAVSSCVKDSLWDPMMWWCSPSVGFLQGCAYQQWGHVLRLTAGSSDVGDALRQWVSSRVVLISSEVMC